MVVGLGEVVCGEVGFEHTDKCNIGRGIFKEDFICQN